MLQNQSWAAPLLLPAGFDPTVCPASPKAQVLVPPLMDRGTTLGSAGSYPARLSNLFSPLSASRWPRSGTASGPAPQHPSVWLRESHYGVASAWTEQDLEAGLMNACWDCSKTTQRVLVSLCSEY